MDVSGSLDAMLLERYAVLVEVTGTAPTEAVSCLQRARLAVGGEIWLHTADEPVTIGVRRFGGAPIELMTVEPRVAARIRTTGLTVVSVPWIVDAPGACIHEP
jgi:hypothetical protein